MYHIAIIAGEASGDQLGADLLLQLQKLGLDFAADGIGGTRMCELGFTTFHPIEKLAVMGITEVAGSYLELRGIRKSLIEKYLEHPPDIFIGIDAPDFNLYIEKELKSAGVKTVHYVSPSVWAWRRGRIHYIKQAVDLMLTLFPFELDIYKENSISAACVGHPVAQSLPMEPDQARARNELGLDISDYYIGLMPGSRESEKKHLLPVFIETAVMLYEEDRNRRFIMNVLDEQSRNTVVSLLASTFPDLPLTVFVNRGHNVIESSDCMLAASGTVTLEGLLFKVPMVVAYKVNFISYLIIRALIRVPYVSLPNLLAEEELVDECLQFQCKAEIICKKIRSLINQPELVSAIRQKYRQIHQNLLGSETNNAGNHIARLLETKA